jgi:choline transport protein
MVSAVPSSGGVYHWASLCPGPKLGRCLGFFAGSLNFFGWLFDLASIVYIMSELVVQMYSLYHPSYVIQPWHIFVALVLITWICIAITIFFNRYLPQLQQFGLFVVIVGGIVTIIVISAMPRSHSSSSFVWSNWANNTGWGSGIAFLTGVLNGAFTIGTPDAVTHMSEEVPEPRKDLPRAIAAQIILGSISTLNSFTSLIKKYMLTFIRCNRRVCLRHSPLLRYYRSRCCPEQQRVFSPG